MRGMMVNLNPRKDQFLNLFFLNDQIKLCINTK